MPDTPTLDTDHMESTADRFLPSTPGLIEAARPWCRRAANRLGEAEAPGRVRYVGKILHVADGVAHVGGLPEARFNELLRFPQGVRGLVFNLEPDRIGCILLGPDSHLVAGDAVEQSGEVVSVPVGEALLGRVVNALGQPLDDGGPIRAEAYWPVEREAPAILERHAVNEQVVTGVKAVDSLVPIGRGQRELIVGDRATGKTAVAVDAILSQRRSDLICIYAAIGQKTATVKTVARDLQRDGAFDRCIVLSADADDSPGLQYLAPYAATTMGEWFMRRGRDVLVVYDDLTRHARAYREVSLLLRRPPGREAYPGDIFFIHARLLERATHLREDAGGGSLTALPVVETQAGNMAAYIPTNLISITDGQIVLTPDLFSKGIKPAIDVGRSVSRVGGKAQRPAIRDLAKDLRLQYARFEELELFTRFGATVEKETRRRIERGRRIRELLRQNRLSPVSATTLMALLLAVQRDLLDSLPVDQVMPFAESVGQELNDDDSEWSGRAEEETPLSEEEADKLAALLEERLERFKTEAGDIEERSA